MTDRPRLLVITPDFPPEVGGIQLLVYEVVHHLTRLRARVVTLDAQGAGEFDRREGLDARRSGSRAWRAAKILGLNASALAEGLRYKPDVVLSAHVFVAPSAQVLRRLAGVPVVQYLYGQEIAARPRLFAFAVRTADRVIAISRHTAAAATAEGVNEANLERIPPGVVIPARGAERASRPTVLTVARLHDRYKGHDVLIRALPLIRARVPDVEWVAVGDGPLRPQLEALVRGAGLDGDVRFTGSVSDDERDAWLDRAHVFAMPSRVVAGSDVGEGFGIVYLEAAAHGLPVVAGNVAGALDAVVDGETGLLMDPTDHVALADAVTELLLDPQKAEALGRAGRERAGNFDWPRIAARVEDVLLAAAARA